MIGSNSIQNVLFSNKCISLNHNRLDIFIDVYKIRGSPKDVIVNWLRVLWRTGFSKKGEDG